MLATILKSPRATKTSSLLSNLIGENLKVDSTETEVELDLALLKVKHKFNRK